MKLRFVEVTQSVAAGPNWGKFAVGMFEPEEWQRNSEMLAREVRPATEHEPMRPYLSNPPVSLLATTGWSREHVFVLDLATGEGAVFLPGGSAVADLSKHRIWVCPMFEPFLAWLYEHVATVVLPDAGPPSPAFMGRSFVIPIHWFERLPELVELPTAPGALDGYRRLGPAESRLFRTVQEVALVRTLLKRHIRLNEEAGVESDVAGPLLERMEKL